MALCKCIDCGKEISDRAEKCIHCGCPNYKYKYMRLCLCDKSIPHTRLEYSIAFQILLDAKGVKTIGNIDTDNFDVRNNKNGLTRDRHESAKKWLRQNIDIIDKEIDMETISLLSDYPKEDFESLAKVIKLELEILEEEKSDEVDLKSGGTEREEDSEINILDRDNVQKIITTTNLIIESIKSQALTILQIRDSVEIQLTNGGTALWLGRLVNAGIIIRTEADGKAFFQKNNISNEELNIKLQKVALENKEDWQRWEKEYEEYRAKERESFINMIQSEVKISERNAIKCPNCGSKDVSKIGIVGRTVSVGFWGLASSSIGKTYKCSKCGYKW